MLKVLGRKEQHSRLVNRTVRELNKLGECSFTKVTISGRDSVVSEQLNKLYNELYRYKGDIEESETMGPIRVKKIEKRWLTKEWNCLMGKGAHMQTNKEILA